jgi:glycosyltransferase involved in cell wall biosynthesis
MHAADVGGLGEIRRSDLPAVEARYRFFFHPVRWTSLGMALIEAMTIGMPIVALATTELPTVLVDGESGFVSTDPARLLDAMRALLRDRDLGRRLGEHAREIALERFSIDRFSRDWTEAFATVTGRPK